MPSFITKGKGKNRKVIPISKSGMSKRSFNNTPKKMKSNFKVPTLPNDPPRFSTDEETALDFIASHPDAIADNLLESTDIGGTTEGTLEDVETVLEKLEDDGKIIKFGDEEFPKYRISVPLSKELDETGDPSSDERIFEVKGLEANPELDDVDPPKIVHSDLIVRVTNFLEVTGDSRFIDEPYVGELLLVPQNRSLSKDVLKKIANSAGIEDDEVDPFDKIIYGASIRLGDEETGVDPIQVANELGKSAPAQAGLIGFALDRPVNRIGDTGWDNLREFALWLLLSLKVKEVIAR